MAAPVKKEIKQEVIDKIKDQGLSVADASNKYGVHHKTIYGWLRNGIGDAHTLELNKLRKENKQLYLIIGELTAEIKTQKK